MSHCIVGLLVRWKLCWATDSPFRGPDRRANACRKGCARRLWKSLSVTNTPTMPEGLLWFITTVRVTHHTKPYELQADGLKHPIGWLRGFLGLGGAFKGRHAFIFPRSFSLSVRHRPGSSKRNGSQRRAPVGQQAKREVRPNGSQVTDVKYRYALVYRLLHSPSLLVEDKWLWACQIFMRHGMWLAGIIHSVIG